MGVILGQWENEERPPLNQPAGEEEEAEEEEDPTKSKISPVYAMDVHSEAVWLAAGLQASPVPAFKSRVSYGQFLVRAVLLIYIRSDMIKEHASMF